MSDQFDMTFLHAHDGVLDARVNDSLTNAQVELLARWALDVKLPEESDVAQMVAIMQRFIRMHKVILRLSTALGVLCKECQGEGAVVDQYLTIHYGKRMEVTCPTCLDAVPNIDELFDTIKLGFGIASDLHDRVEELEQEVERLTKIRTVEAVDPFSVRGTSSNYADLS